MEYCAVKNRSSSRAIQLVAFLFAGAAAFQIVPASAADIYLTYDDYLWDDALSGANYETDVPICSYLMQGEIRQGDTSRLGQTVREGRGSRSILCLDSPGGSLFDVLDYDDYLLPTAVMPGATCDSACAILFLRGRYIRQDQRGNQDYSSTLWPGGNLGFHAPGLDLPQGGTFTNQQVQQAFAASLESAERLQELARTEDSWGRVAINDYLLARILETPPEELYRIETVGDALYAEINVAGVDAVMEDLDTTSRSICDNRSRPSRWCNSGGQRS